MKKRLLLLSLLAVMAIGAWAQRTVDVIDRGLVAVKVNGGVYCSCPAFRFRFPAAQIRRLFC